MPAEARTMLTALFLCCICGTGVNAQVVVHSSTLDDAPTTAAGSVAATPSSFVAAFGIEALGGATGAALGYGALMLTGDDLCGEDLACTLRNAGTALLLGAAGAAVGTYAAGRMAGTAPSGWGALVGTLAGAAAVIGLDHALGDMGDGTRVVLFSVTHGTLAALGSRAFAALR
jgi:hypothetical protein